MRVYKSKVDSWLVMVCVMGIVVPYIIGFKKGDVSLLSFLICLCITALTVAMLFSIRYELDETNLRIKGFLVYKKTIAVGEIVKLEESRSLLSSPAASIRRIEIIYNKYDSVLVSPKDQEAFISDLLKSNPAIVVKYRQK